MMRHILPLTIVALSIAARANAQLNLGPTSPKFQEIARLAQDGYGDSARASIARLVTKIPANDPSFPEALYTAGVVARTGDSMRANFKRIATDYETSPWADKALVRLAQLEYGFGNMDLVIVDVTRLFSDYPNSAGLPTAALWGARAAMGKQKPQLACEWLTKGIAAAANDLELRNQLLYAKQSCTLSPGVTYAPPVSESLRAGPPPTRIDSSVKPPVTNPPPPPPPSTAKPPAKTTAPAAASPWRVQVAAVSDQSVIKRLQAKIEAGGFKVYLVPGPKGLTKIQVGPFATRPAAVAGIPRVKAIAGGSPIVVPAP